MITMRQTSSSLHLLVVIGLTALAGLLSLPSPAAAMKDIRISMLAEVERGERQASFNWVTRELAMSIAAPPTHSVSSLGMFEFELSTDHRIAFVHDSTGAGRSPWSEMTEDGEASEVQYIPRITIRKGLPYSFEVGGNLGWLGVSRQFVVGGYGRWAMLAIPGIVIPEALGIPGGVWTETGKVFLDGETGRPEILGNPYIFTAIEVALMAAVEGYRSEDTLEEVAGTFLHGSSHGSVRVVGVHVAAHPAPAEVGAADQGGNHAGGQAQQRHQFTQAVQQRQTQDVQQHAHARGYISGGRRPTTGGAEVGARRRGVDVEVRRWRRQRDGIAAWAK